MDYLERVMRWLQSDHPLAVVADWSLKLALALLLLLIGWRIASQIGRASCRERV